MSAKLKRNFWSILGSLLYRFMYKSIFDSSRVILTPSLTTSGGSLLTTEATLFCTFTAAKLGSVPRLNTTCIVASPSLPASDAIYFIPGIPLIALSRGMSTAFVMSSPLAPGYSAVTFTLGGEMEGNCVTGNLVIANTPIKTITSDITIDRTGLCINLLNMMCIFW